MNSLVWSAKQLCSLFDVDWESTQLCALLPKIDLPDACSISGGAIVRTLLKEDLFKGDIDIFAHTETGLRKALDQYSKNKDWTPTKHAYTCEFADGVRKTKLQVITKDKPDIVGNTLSTFDFEHCKFALLTSPSGFDKFKKRPDHAPSFVTTMCSHMFLATKQLRLGLVRQPEYSLGRAIKYKRMGFDADKAIEQLVAMSLKGMKDVQCCDKDDWSRPLNPAEIDRVIATASS
jgi:hypothetical protein